MAAWYLFLMKNLKSALTDLENIVNTTILQYNLPVEKGQYTTYWKYDCTQQQTIWLCYR